MPRAEREAQMLEVAGRVFAELGYHEASMDVIASRSGVSKPMLYAYLGSKQELYLAYIRIAAQDLVGRMRRAPEDGAGPMARFRAGVEAFFSFVEEQRDGWAVLYQEAASQGGSIAGEVASMRAQIAGMIGLLLQECARSHGNDVPAQERTEARSHLVVGSGESLANWWIAHPWVQREAIVDWFVASMVPALQAGAREHAGRIPRYQCIDGV